MNRLESFNTFLATQSVQVPVLGFLINLIAVAFLAYLLGLVYIRYGRSLSNRRLFAHNFVVLAITIMLIITVVKSSLALSLGLVGALSIVRFRAAIKEPEELAFLFMTIAIGLGFGADQGIITTIALAFLCVLVWIRSRFHRGDDGNSLLLEISSESINRMRLEEVIASLKNFCTDVDLRRYAEEENLLEASFLICCDDPGKLESCIQALREGDSTARIAFVDNKGLL